MKKNFTKILLASAAVSTIGLTYAAKGGMFFAASALDNEEFVVEWGATEDQDLSEDMINLGLPLHFACNLPANDNPNDYSFDITATLYEFVPAVSNDEVDPGFNQPAVVPVVENATFPVYVEAGSFVTYLFPETLEAGKTYAVSLTQFNATVYGQTYSEDCQELWANPTTTFTVAYSNPEVLEFDAYLVNGEEQLSLNTHSAVSVESAEAIAVNFINGLDVKYATYAIDQLGDEVVTLSSGALSINTVGYAAFEQPLTFISGTQYKVTVKAWDTTDVLDENLNVVEPLLAEEYLINGASAMGVIGEPVFGVERGEFPEDMCMLGVPVRFPELKLPFGVVAEDCDITVSASLYGVPQGNEPMPLSMDDDIDPGMGVDGPVALAEGVLFNANVEGGVVTAMLFPEMMEAGNHYAIVLNAVTVIDAEGEIVAELPEDAYYAVDFDVTPYVAPIELGWAEFLGLENGVVDVEDTMIHGVKVAFPAANFGTDDAVLYVLATLYDVTDMGQLAGDDVDNMGVVGPVAVAQNLFTGGLNVETATYEVALFTEQFVAGRKYVISLETILAETQNGQVILQWDNTDEEWASDIFEVVSTALEVAPAFVAGEDEIALNGHSAVSVESAEALVVRFVNGANIKVATYAIDQVEEDNLVSLASGALSLSTVGYVAFEQPLTFISGYQYKLTVKAWDVTETLDENLNVVEPVAVEEYLFNGANAMGVIGEPVFGVTRGQVEEDMCMLGVPVRFPELKLPFGVVAEDCEITVSASLYGVPQGNEPMPLAMDDDVDPGMGVDGPVALAEGVLFNANVVGGVVTAMLFPEMMEVGNHYAIMLNAVTVIDAEGEVVAELPADAYYAVDFDVVPAAPVYAFGEPVWGLEGDEEAGYEIGEDQATLGVVLEFPFAEVPAEAVCVADVMLYGIMPGGAEGGIMPLSADDGIDPGFGNVPTVLPLYDEPVKVYGNDEGGVIRFNLAAEDLAVGNYYAIEVLKVAALVNDVEAFSVENITSPVFTVYEVLPEEPMVIEPSFVAGEEVITLNTHSAVSVESAESLVVNFINGPMVKYATYAIDEYAYDEEAGEMVWYDQLGGGALSLNTRGYAEFNPALTFVAGHQYVLTVKAWDVAEIFDENWNMAQPIAVEEFTFNGAADAAKLGEPVWGIERGEFAEDMINLGVPVSFPELSLPFGVVPEDCAVVVWATLSEEGTEGEDDLDPGFGLNAQYFFANVEGGVVSAYLFPEQLEVGKTYTINLLGLQFYTLDLEDMILDIEGDSSVTFTVVPGEDNPTAIKGINAEGAKIMFNLNGQQVKNANGVVVMKGVKALVK